MEKPWWQSRVVWFNLAVLAFTFLVDDVIAQHLRDLGLSDQMALRITAVGNIGLRCVSMAKLVLSVPRG